jgi:rhodanese-related sulfurtransferase
MKEKKHYYWIVCIIAAAFTFVLSGCSGATTISTATSPVLTTPPPTTDTTTTPGRKDISVSDAHALIENYRGNPDFVILDVRTPPEYADGHIEGAINIDYEAADFRDRVSKLDKVKTYLVYCRTGARSAAASDIMVGLGFKYIDNMTGGITDWQAAGFPVVQ